MNCPSCGAELPDGAKFCGVCGNPIPGDVQAQPQQMQGGYPQQMQGGYQQQMQGGYPQQMQGGYQQPGMQPNMIYVQKAPSQSGMVFADMWRLFGEGITRPYSAFRSVIDRGRHIQGFLIGMFDLIVVFLLILIHVPFGNYSSYGGYDIGFRATQALYTVILMTGVYFLTALAGYIFRDKVKNYSYMQILGMLGSTTVYVVFAIAAEFLFGLFSAPMASIFEYSAIAVWTGFSVLVIKEVAGGSEDAKVNKAVFSEAVVLFSMMLLQFTIEKVGEMAFFGLMF